VYMDESPNRERQVPMPMTNSTRKGEKQGFIVYPMALVVV
jgi:hypothetical protein